MRFLRAHVKFFIFGIVSVAATFWIGAQIVGYQFGDDRYPLHASFEDATQLRAGDPVQVSGVPVGQVTAVAVDRGRAEVDFKIDADVQLPTDTVVAVRSENIIGTRELLLTPGSSPTMLQPDSRVQQTSNAIDLGALINELGPLLESVDSGRLNELVVTLNDTLAGNRGTIAGITDDLVLVLDRLASRSATITQIIDDYQVIVGEVGRRDRQIQQVVDNLVLISTTFEDSESVLIDALETLPDFSQRLDALLEANAGNLESVLGDLALVTDTVVDNLALLDETLRVTPPALLGLATVTGQGDFLTTNFLCIATAPPPCPAPITDVNEGGTPSIGNTLADILNPILSPLPGLLDGLGLRP